jgi:hypothetical protein
MATCNLFQFHKGTIKTCKLIIGDAEKSHFNSIKVRLKQGNLRRRFRPICYFNSIKVRLKPE